MTRYTTSTKGFNLIEIILALVLFAITVPAVGHLFAVAFTQESDNTLHTQATFLASQLMDEISERRFRQSAGLPGNCADTGEISSYDRRLFNDIDDYAIFSKDCAGVAAWGDVSPPRDESGNSLTAFSKFSQKVEVYNIVPPTDGPSERVSFDAALEGTTDFKMVVVTVSWDSSRRNVKLYKVFALNI